MKKLFAFVAAMMAVVAVNATVVTLNPSDFTAVTTAAAIDQTVKDVKVVISNGVINDTQIRVYKSKTITLTCTKAISAVVFTCTNGGTDQYGPGNFETAAGTYSYKNTVGTWLGDATSVTLTASGAQVRATKIEVYLDGETPAIDTWVPDTVTVSAARTLIGEEDTHDHFVKGVIAGQPFNLYDDMKDGKISFWLTDIAAPTDSLEAYQVLGKNQAKWENVEAAWEELRVGDTVLVYAAALSKYQEIYEIASGYYDSKLGANPNPPAIQYPDTITATEAFEIAKALADPAENGKSTTTPEEYIIGGYAVKVWDRNTDKTWSFGMADVENGRYDFQASNATIVDGNDTVIKNDYMYVRGKIAKRKTNSGNLQYQVYKGTAVHGEAPALEMDTVGAVEAYNRAQALPVDGSELLCIEAYVAQIKDAYSTEHGNITVWLNDDPSSTYGNIQAYRASCSAEDGAAIVEHCRVRVVGNIVHTTWEDAGTTKHTYQIAQGAKLVLLNGAGVEQTIILDKAVKMIENGQLIIEKNGVKYNAQGAVVK